MFYNLGINTPVVPTVFQNRPQITANTPSDEETSDGSPVNLSGVNPLVRPVSNFFDRDYIYKRAFLTKIFKANDLFLPAASEPKRPRIDRS